MSPDATDRDEDLVELLDDLEATLAELRSELRGETGSGPSRQFSPRRSRRERPGAGRDLPRPPSVSELLGFTERYTLPTLISTLEATIRALELLQGALRLVNPDRSDSSAPPRRRDTSRISRLGTGAAGVGQEAISGVERALSELETALANSEVPDRASDELLAEVRNLSAEVETRLEAARGAGTADRGGRQREMGEFRPEEPDAGGVAIEVTDAEDAGDVDGTPDDAGDVDATPDDADPEGRPDVDVDAELESIKHEVRGTDDPDIADDNVESADGGEHGKQSGDDEGSAPTGDREDQ